MPNQTRAADVRRAKTEPKENSRPGDIIGDRIEALAAITDEPGRLTRLYLGPAHRQAAEVVSGWMRDAGMAVHMDAVGTVVGRYEGQFVGAPSLILGSHIDTVPNAGRYDGTLGVLTAIAAVERLQAKGKRLPFAVEVVAFGDEEGIRFPGTLTGSRALAGKFEPRVLDEIDGDGISRRQALAAFGCDVALIPALARDPKEILSYLEVHIEQGPVLEVEAHPVGVVTAINGATRGRVTVKGEAGHAGTVPMSLRRDALAAAAEMIVAVEAFAHKQSGLVATVGLVEVPHGAVNAVAAEVRFTLDVRSPSDDDRAVAIRALQTEFAQIARSRSVAAEVEITYTAPSALCDARLTGALARTIETAGLTVRELASGAGHDAMSFKDTIPFAMLFVRCRGGISHSPAEYTSPEDIDTAARILADCVETLSTADFAEKFGEGGELTTAAVDGSG